VLGKQLLRSGTSIGANVEEAQAAQSVADFVAKMTIALKEARENRYWLLLLVEAELLPAQRLAEITNETEEIIKILFSIIQKAKQRFKTP
jgi:four helix bundle protein